MKKILLSISLCTCIFTVFAQAGKEIAKVMYDQQTAWNSGNIDQFMESYWKSDSLLFVGKTGPNYGWQTTLNNYKKHYPDVAAMGILNFNIIKINVLDRTNAFVLGAWHLTRAQGNLGGYFTLWFRKFTSGWKIVADHTS